MHIFLFIEENIIPTHKRNNNLKMAAHSIPHSNLKYENIMKNIDEIGSRINSLNIKLMFCMDIH